MPTMTGRALIAQEGRLHLLTDDGAGHLFLLSPRASAETAQLRPLARRGARVEIDYAEAPHVIGFVALRVRIGEGGSCG